MPTLRLITAAEVRHQQRERERDRMRERDKTLTRKRRKEILADRERERDRIGIFSMMAFNLATFSFLDLLVKKIIQKKMDKYKIKNKSFQIRSKKIPHDFLSKKFDHVTHLQDLKCFVGQ